MWHAGALRCPSSWPLFKRSPRAQRGCSLTQDLPPCEAALDAEAEDRVGFAQWQDTSQDQAGDRRNRVVLGLMNIKHQEKNINILCHWIMEVAQEVDLPCVGLLVWTIEISWSRVQIVQAQFFFVIPEIPTYS